MFRVWSTAANMDEEDLVLQNIDSISEPDITAVTTPEEIIDFQEKTKKVYVADNIRHYLLEILNKLRHHQDVQVGPSTRAGIALLTGSRSMAFLHGREFVLPDDIKKLLIPVLSHRLQMTPESEMEDITPEDTIREVSTTVPVPKMTDE